LNLTLGSRVVAVGR
jgi:predicted DsbA family dithiol-disulfide isomerase